MVACVEKRGRIKVIGASLTRFINPFLMAKLCRIRPPDASLAPAGRRGRLFDNGYPILKSFALTRK
jgi:hypothetical protein